MAILVKWWWLTDFWRTWITWIYKGKGKETLLRWFFIPGLLGLNIKGWAKSGVNHVLIFELDPRHHSSHLQVVYHHHHHHCHHHHQHHFYHHYSMWRFWSSPLVLAWPGRPLCFFSSLPTTLLFQLLRGDRTFHSLLTVEKVFVCHKRNLCIIKGDWHLYIWHNGDIAAPLVCWPSTLCSSWTQPRRGSTRRDSGWWGSSSGEECWWFVIMQSYTILCNVYVGLCSNVPMEIIFERSWEIVQGR